MEGSYKKAYFSKCRWVSEKGTRCMQRSQYVGNFCKRHCLGDYVYKENGIMSEGCSNVLSRRVRVDSIKSVETYGENKFVSKDGTKYEYVSSAVTYVIMRRLGTEEEVVFWKDTESRGTRGGYLINMLTTVPFDDYCDDIAVCRIDGEYYCKECFENTFRGKVRSLMETAEVEETIPEKNLSTV